MSRLEELLNFSDVQLQQACELLIESFNIGRDSNVVAVYVPGRVEFLGKHTDYAGGRSLLMTVQKGFRMVAHPRRDDILRIATGRKGQPEVQQFVYGQIPPHQPGHWVNYTATLARRLLANFGSCPELTHAGKPSLLGADIAFVSDLPIAAGMSSSSALVVAMFLCISQINHLDHTETYRREIHSNIDLAAYLGCVEMGLSFGSLAGQQGVGTFGGSEDHTAMLCCKPETLSQFSFAPSVFEREIPFPSNMELVIACSGIQAVKTGSAKEKYNRASIRARKAAEAYNRATGDNCRHLRDVAARVGPNGLDKALRAIRQGTAPKDEQMDLPGRFEQFFHEDQEIIPAVGDALIAGNVDAIGPLIDKSHANARKWLNNVIPETDFLYRSARQLGAVAASYFGAGFGGSVWAMVEKDAAENFRIAWNRTYSENFPERSTKAEYFRTVPGKPASVISQVP